MFCAVFVIGIEGKGLFIILNGEIFLASCRVCFGKAVIRIPGIWIFLDVALKHLDGQVSLLLHQQVIAKAVEAAFVHLVFLVAGAPGLLVEIESGLRAHHVSISMRTLLPGSGGGVYFQPYSRATMPRIRGVM